MYFTKLSCISISGDEKGCKVLGRVVLLHKALRGQRGDNALKQVYIKKKKKKTNKFLPYLESSFCNLIS